MDSSKFNKDYFMNGAESNYIDYPKRKYNELAKEITEILKLKKTSKILDYGCACGNLVKSLDKYCQFVDGVDISKWAVNYARKNNKIKGYFFNYNKNILSFIYDFIIFLDVLEHCNSNELKDILLKINKNKYVEKILVRIPVCQNDGDDFLLECSRKDKTHIQCHSKIWWQSLFNEYGFKLETVINKKHIYESEGVLTWVLIKEKN